ncbi:MAG: flagellar export protein FliJ [Oscillospiraceae bacterium]|nr:flagellar export protein FliJ [Oscillospiraceae bacterium]
MKKFHFTLDTLLNFKDQVLEREKNSLASLNAQKLQALELKAALEQEMREAQDDFNYRAQKGISAMEMFIFKEHHNTLRLQIEDAKRSIESLEAAVEKQLYVVTEASKEVKSLEKLEEKQLEDYNFKAAKADELFIEEYVNGASVRASMAENAV